MKKLTDEILNKYIDGELSAAEINLIKFLIKSDPVELNKLKAHKLADQILSRLEVEPAPDGFTERMMLTIYEISTVAPKRSYFVLGVIGVLVTGIISIFVYTLIGASQADESAVQLPSKVSQALDTVTEKVSAFSEILNDKSIMMIGIALTLILIITAFSMLSSYKSFKNSLDNFGK